jgi:hypothetical protein
VDVIRAAIAAIVVVTLGCGAPAPAPGDVVARYFASLGRDPIRSLPLTTDAFHREHGLGIVTTSEARAWRGGEPIAVAPSVRVDRAQVAWLAIQNRAEFARLVRELVVAPEDARVDGDLATVAVAVAPPQGPSFVQTFRLTRADPRSAWRIDAIEQSGVARDNELFAFVAHPTEPARRALERRVQLRGAIH